MRETGDLILITRLSVVSVMVAGITVAVAVLWLTAPVPGVTVDSGEYLSAAERLRDGQGLSMPYVSYGEPYPKRLSGELHIPVTHFPPVYPTVLAILSGASGQSVLAVSQWVNAVAYGVAAALAGALVAVVAPWPWAAITTLAFLFADLATVAAMAWSEPLALLFGMSALVALQRYLRTGTGPALAALALSCSAGAMTRYASVAVALASCLALLTLKPRRRRRRTLAATVTITGATGVPLAAWFWRTNHLTGRTSDTGLGWHPPTFDLTAFWWRLVSGGSGAGMLRLTVLTMLVVIVAFRPKSQNGKSESRPTPAQRLAVLAIVFAAAHLFILLLARTVLYANVPLDARQAAPAFAFAVVSAGAWGSGRGLLGRPRPMVGGVLAAIAAIAIVPHCAQVYRDFDSGNYRGYTAPRWLNSPTLAALASVPRDRKIVTNAPDALWLYQGREPLLIPRPLNPYTGEANPAYERQLTELATVAGRQPVLVAFFDRPTREPRPQVLAHAVRHSLGLKLIADFADGTIYAATPLVLTPAWS